MLRLLRRLLTKRPARTAGEAAPERQPEKIDRADTAERIEILARGGFETEASTLETILDEYLNPDEVDADDRRWIEAEVARAYARKRADEATWPLETDFDRLAVAFDALDAGGIIALHRAGYTRSDGISDAAEVCHQRRERGRSSRGFVFYHGQDVEAVVADRGSTSPSARSTTATRPWPPSPPRSWRRSRHRDCARSGRAMWASASSSTRSCG